MTHRIGVFAHYTEHVKKSGGRKTATRAQPSGHAATNEQGCLSIGKVNACRIFNVHGRTTAAALSRESTTARLSAYSSTGLQEFFRHLDNHPQPVKQKKTTLNLYMAYICNTAQLIRAIQKYTRF